MAHEDNRNEAERPQADNRHTELKRAKRPFDTSDVSWVPDLQENDPPYRDWWVVHEERNDR
jgi:hypothetical protein